MSDTGLPVEDRLQIGVQTIHRRTEPAVGPWLPTIEEMRSLVELVDRSGYDSLWVGDHISFHIAIFDPLLQLAQAAVLSRRLVFGTGVYLVPLRHPTPVAKQVATLDHLAEGRFIFGVGVGGEFAKEFEPCGDAQAVERAAGEPPGSLLQLRRRVDATAAAPDRRAADLVRRPLGRRP